LVALDLEPTQNRGDYKPVNISALAPDRLDADENTGNTHTIVGHGVNWRRATGQLNVKFIELNIRLCQVRSKRSLDFHQPLAEFTSENISAYERVTYPK
jgi:hypothetical protein